MSSFEEREKSFEKKFAYDEELQFKVSARRNKYLGQWASQILGYNQNQEKEYIQMSLIFLRCLKMILLFTIHSCLKEIII